VRTDEFEGEFLPSNSQGFEPVAQLVWVFPLEHDWPQDTQGFRQDAVFVVRDRRSRARQDTPRLFNQVARLTVRRAPTSAVRQSPVNCPQRGVEHGEHFAEGLHGLFG
jgi:hypothetical protein